MYGIYCKRYSGGKMMAQILVKVGFKTKAAAMAYLEGSFNSTGTLTYFVDRT
jgi:hypothetical protein